MPAQPVQGHEGGDAPDFIPAAGKATLPDLASRYSGKGQEYGAHRLFLAAAAGAGNPRYGKSEVTAGSVPDAGGHGNGRLGTDSPVCRNHLRGHTQSPYFGGIAVGDCTLDKVRGTAGDIGDPLCQKPAGTRLGKGEGQARPAQAFRHDRVEGVAISSENEFLQPPPCCFGADERAA